MEITFKKVHTSKDLIISGLICLVGVGLFFVNTWACMALVAFGLLSFLLYKDGWKRIGDNMLLRKKSLELCRTCRPAIIDLLNGKTVDSELVLGNEGGTICLQVWYNRKENVAFAQLFDFLEMSFQKATEIVELPTESAKKIIEKL